MKIFLSIFIMVNDSIIKCVELNYTNIIFMNINTYLIFMSYYDNSLRYITHY